MPWLLSLLNVSWVQTFAVGAGCLLLGAAGGFVQGFNYANVEALQNHIAALQRAADNSEAIAEADRKAADVAREEADHLKTEIENVVNAKPDKSTACLLSSEQLAWLQRIAASGR